MPLRRTGMKRPQKRRPVRPRDIPPKLQAWSNRCKYVRTKRTKRTKSVQDPAEDPGKRRFGRQCGAPPPLPAAMYEIPYSYLYKSPMHFEFVTRARWIYIFCRATGGSAPARRKRWKGAAPVLFGPCTPGANMGRPSRGRGPGILLYFLHVFLPCMTDRRKCKATSGHAGLGRSGSWVRS